MGLIESVFSDLTAGLVVRHDTTAELLAEVNGLMPLRPVRPGQILLLPQE